MEHTCIFKYPVKFRILNNTDTKIYAQEDWRNPNTEIAYTYNASNKIWALLVLEFF